MFHAFSCCIAINGFLALLLINLQHLLVRSTTCCTIPSCNKVSSMSLVSLISCPLLCWNLMITYAYFSLSYSLGTYSSTNLSLSSYSFFCLLLLDPPLPWPISFPYFHCLPLCLYIILMWLLLILSHLVPFFDLLFY